MSFFSLNVLLSVLLQNTLSLATTFPTTLEVDLLFPLHANYSSTLIFPFLFVLQNAPLSPLLEPSITLQVWDTTYSNVPNGTLYSPAVRFPLSPTNYTVADTIFVYGFIDNLPVGRHSLI